MRGLIRIGLIVLLALVAGLVFRGLFLASSQEAPRPKVIAKVGVCTAGQALPMGLLLKEDDFVWKETPEDQIKSTMIVKGSAVAARLVGAVIRRPVAEGVPLAERDVVFPDAPGFLAAALAPGMRAVSVAIDDVTGNAGLILPGDRVDLLLTQKLEDSLDGRSDRQVASETALSDLRVIAVGSSMKVPDNDGSSPSLRSAHTVTLEVSPEDAEKVAVATRLGQLSLALRSLASPRRAETVAPSPGDGEGEPGGIDALPDERMTLKPTWGEDVSMAMRMRDGNRKPHAAQPTQPAARPVQIFRGSQREGGQASGGFAAAPSPEFAVPSGIPAPLAESFIPDLRHAR
ncbi:Flp pilus assembly protein CpaB [Magnetospirillum fulvum MGU-K5]|uniref:Flp pilus assembly protein CpaB n=1 Tax=Magnetospirillum fulvum MGU-K5 TaxID=1316936 RepID=S9S5I4_MAGFU|nr:Flp pilus assembly protein CpaB [Magnetospirillum fulvum MGU-K5]